MKLLSFLGLFCLSLSLNAQFINSYGVGMGFQDHPPILGEAPSGEQFFYSSTNLQVVNLAYEGRFMLSLRDSIHSSAFVLGIPLEIGFSTNQQSSSITTTGLGHFEVGALAYLQSSNFKYINWEDRKWSMLIGGGVKYIYTGLINKVDNTPFETALIRPVVSLGFQFKPRFQQGFIELFMAFAIPKKYYVSENPYLFFVNRLGDSVLINDFNDSYTQSGFSLTLRIVQRKFD